MLDFNLVQVKNKEAGFYPTILDRNPILAANFLTIEDSKRIYKGMLNAYDSLKRGDNKYPFIQDSLLHSRKNFIWFAQYFKELEKINDGINSYKIPYDKFPESYDTSENLFYPPFVVVKRGKNYVTKELKYRIPNLDPINLYRVQYIKRGCQLEDFREGFPAWYLIDQGTIYERYNEKTNLRVRIDFVGGEFVYFVAGASDNWMQIVDVPLEIDFVVSALLFRSSCLEDY